MLNAKIYIEIQKTPFLIIPINILFFLTKLTKKYKNIEYNNLGLLISC
jgi:hypothetical protein